MPSGSCCSQLGWQMWCWSLSQMGRGGCAQTLPPSTKPVRRDVTPFLTLIGQRTPVQGYKYRGKGARRRVLSLFEVKREEKWPVIWVAISKASKIQVLELFLSSLCNCDVSTMVERVLKVKDKGGRIRLKSLLDAPNSGGEMTEFFMYIPNTSLFQFLAMLANKEAI
ncbi:hypothetical protein LIER_10725 [Lithospermum erythrorhizon]|uniref:Uncharacterized protein n=1 Tax=Lithospermum erythrorhizon TaxID=34254 RepID=A0AAV3PKA4_LITER